MRATPLTVEECAFEPESTEIRCVECDKPTGLMGTCADRNFCDSCREEFIQGCMEDGTTRQKAEAQVSARMISMIEGAPYKAKYMPRRVMHLSIDGRPACGVKGGPHPMTENKNEVNWQTLRDESENSESSVREKLKMFTINTFDRHDKFAGMSYVAFYGSRNGKSFDSWMSRPMSLSRAFRLRLRLERRFAGVTR